MKAPTTGLGIAAALLALALAPAACSAASSGSIVPPENSAASQYTEALPTVGGSKQPPGNAGKSGHRSPAKVLGASNAHKLESHGKSGREVAEVAASTAPSSQTPVEEAPAAEPKRAQSGNAKPANAAQQQRQEPGPSSESTRRTPRERRVDIPNGSSGLAALIGQATGSSSSGELGPLLPLAIVGALLWAVAYFRRQRRQLD